MENSPIFPDSVLKLLMDKIREENPKGMSVVGIAQEVRNAVEQRVRERSLEGVLSESVPWSEATFPEATISSITTHLIREWRELVDSNFNDSEEYADVVLLMAHLASRKNFDLASSTRDKFEINKARKWGEMDAEGVVEHVRDEPTVHFMKMGPDGKPYGIGSSEQRVPVPTLWLKEKKDIPGMNTYAPPFLPTWRAIVRDGVVVFEKMIFQNHSGGEHSWKRIDPNTMTSSSDNATLMVCRKLQELADMGIELPIQLSAHVDVSGSLILPTLNERWEAVVETSNGKFTGRKGRVQSYRIGGKDYVSEIIWDEEEG